MSYKFDPKLDLSFERTVHLTPEQLFKGWTDSEILKKWFCPRPWFVSECEIDLQPGGAFNNVMNSPEGQKFSNFGSYLEVVKNQKIVWSNSLTAGYRPNSMDSSVSFLFTAIVTFEPVAEGTKYRAVVMHRSEEDCKKHAAMGFEDGWGIALQQLIDFYQK